MAPEVGTSSSLVVADPNALQIIFRNLIENTARHAQAPVAHARVSLEHRGREVWVTFVDDGKGFEGDGGRLGSLFFRGARSQGAGVGLYLIHSLMDLMGGRAEFNPGTGRGFETRLHFRSAEDAT
jgi:signal transduction histidine kinase